MNGYREGTEKAKAELEHQLQEFQKKEEELEKEYEALFQSMETDVVDAITGIYGHVFHVDLQAYREILVHLISTTIRKIDGNREFLVHVSKEDYPYVSMQKKQIAAGTSSSNSSLEIIEDMSLGKNECIIETEGGIFDCGLGTQLAELEQKLKLLSYSK